MSLQTYKHKRVNIDDDLEGDIDKPASDCCDCDFEMSGDQKKIALVVGGVICGIGVLLLVILVPLSVMNVAHDEYAIRYDDLTNTIYPEVYTEGKYVFTPQTTFFIYSNLVKKIELDLTCLTANGIEVELDVDIQYQIEKNNVFGAFEAFGIESNAIKYFKLMALDSILDSCGEFDAKHFYEDRLSIQNTLEAALIRDARISHTYFNVTAAVLSGYDFPLALEDAIRDKRSAENDIAIAENEREGALVEAQTVLLQAEIEADKLKIEAQAEVDSILAEADASANAIEQQWINRQNVYENIMTQMNMTVDQFVYQYLSSVVLQASVQPITSLL